MSTHKPRLLILPGLHGSGADHWQTWLERQHPDAVRVPVSDWQHGDLDAWAAALDQVLRQGAASRWLLVAHSFGCLVFAHWATQRPPAATTAALHAALLVAPAHPARFGARIEDLDRRLPCPSTVVTSRNDPWLEEADARMLARRWGAATVDAGFSGHINPASGHGLWPLGAELVAQALRSPAERSTPAARSWQGIGFAA